MSILYIPWIANCVIMFQIVLSFHLFLILHCRGVVPLHLCPSSFLVGLLQQFRGCCCRLVTSFKYGDKISPFCRRKMSLVLLATCNEHFPQFCYNAVNLWNIKRKKMFGIEKVVLSRRTALWSPILCKLGVIFLG